MRITFTITALDGGGAERVLVLLAKGFLKRGHNVSVVSIAGKETDFYELPLAINRIGLDLKQASPTLFHALWNTGARLFKLRQAIISTQPDVIISFIPHMNILGAISLVGTGYPMIVTEHCSAKDVPCGQPWDALRHIIYPRTQTIVSVSKGVDSEFSWVPSAKRTVIYNPFLTIPSFPEPIDYPAGVSPEKKWIAAMGRLHRDKGFDLLLKAFQKVAHNHPDWQLLILGEGDLGSELQTLAQELGLSDRVVFTGLVSNPFPILQKSELFVLPSRTEGFPMALGEALSCGTAAIAADCVSGIRELMREDQDGLIVPKEDIAALASAMDHLMSDDSERSRLAAHAPDILNRFGLETILDQWETLIDGTLQPTAAPVVGVS